MNRAMLADARGQSISRSESLAGDGGGLHCPADWPHQLSRGRRRMACIVEPRVPMGQCFQGSQGIWSYVRRSGGGALSSRECNDAPRRPDSSNMSPAFSVLTAL
jgi:hypothetical protein